jgi:hypothetical protein
MSQVLRVRGDNIGVRSSGTKTLRSITMGIRNLVTRISWKNYKKIVAVTYVVLTAAVALVFGWQYGFIVVGIAAVDASAVYICNKKIGRW